MRGRERSASPATTASSTAGSSSAVGSRSDHDSQSSPTRMRGRAGAGGGRAGGSAATNGGGGGPPVSVGDKLSNVLLRSDDYLSRYAFISKTSNKFGIRPIWLFTGAVAAFFFFFGYFNTLVSHVIGFFYPAWQSFKAIEGGRKSEVTQWLTYWVVYSLFSFMELFGDVLLHWIPLYYVLKVAFLLWMFLPQFQGAALIYNSVLRPILIRHERLVDSWIDRVSGGGKKIYDGVVNEINNHVVGGLAAGGYEERDDGRKN